MNLHAEEKFIEHEAGNVLTVWLAANVETDKT